MTLDKALFSFEILSKKNNNKKQPTCFGSKYKALAKGHLMSIDNMFRVEIKKTRGPWATIHSPKKNNNNNNNKKKKNDKNNNKKTKTKQQQQKTNSNYIYVNAMQQLPSVFSQQLGHTFDRIVKRSKVILVASFLSSSGKDFKCFIIYGHGHHLVQWRGTTERIVNIFSTEKPM